MRGLKIIPMFLFLVVLTFFGMMFVQANGTEVVIKLGSRETPPTPIGFVVLVSILLGMFVCGILCIIEIASLHIQNNKLRKRLPPKAAPQPPAATPMAPAQDLNTQRTSGRFT